MRIDVVSLFPELITTPLSTSIMGRAQEKGALELHAHDLREHGIGRHRQVDDTPYGGGQGMVLRPEPIFEAHAEFGRRVSVPKDQRPAWHPLAAGERLKVG